MATAAVSVRTDYNLVDLTRLAGSVSQTPPHQVLGFYADSIGFRVQTPTPDAGVCPDGMVEVEVVTTQRLIEVASDIGACLTDVALKHYRLHAELQTQALTRSTQELEPALQQYLADTMSSDGSIRAAPVLSDGRLHAFIAQWLDNYQKAVPSLQAAADTPAELAALRQACSI